MTAPVVCSSAVWRATLAIFEPYQEAGLEGGCYWYADASDPSRVVSVVGVPRQLNGRRHFDVTAEDLAALNASIAPELTVVAQLHGHPERWVGLSDWDLAMTLSRRVLSIVLPDYGPPTTRPRDCGVHVWTGLDWSQVARHSVEAWLQVDDSDGPFAVVDTR